MSSLHESADLEQGNLRCSEVLGEPCIAAMVGESLKVLANDRIAALVPAPRRAQAS